MGERLADTMNVSDDFEQCFSSLHMIEEKLIMNDRNIVNVEWITRKMSDVNNPNYNYEYNDEYYLNYIDSLNIESLLFLSNIVRNYFFDDIKNGKLHIWLIAFDYYSDEKKKYKIYLKCDSELKFRMDYIMSNIISDKKELLKQINEFINIQYELSVYGFDICADCIRWLKMVGSDGRITNMRSKILPVKNSHGLCWDCQLTSSK